MESNEVGATGWDGTERRTQLRLRAIIDDLQAGVRENRGRLDELAERLTELAKQVEALRTPPSAR